MSDTADTRERKRVGKKVRDLRKAREMSLDDLARASDTDKGYLSRIENGQTEPSGRCLRRIAQALGASVQLTFS
jgi:transcriptional regulator with XRE-family HTH domain